MNLRILAMTENKAKAILDMLARKIGYLDVKLKYNVCSKQFNLRVFSDALTYSELYFEKLGHTQLMSMPHESTYKDVLAIMFVFIEQGWDVTTFDDRVFMRANTTVDELLVQLDLEV